ncbi:MAG: DUF3341 domain-containing protein [Phycisphaerales bacterium JB043]
MSETTTTWGVLAEFETPTALYKGCERIRDAGFSRWDAYSPFPVHHLDEAMGLKPSRVSWICGTGAALGVSGAMLMQWWMSAVDYKIVVNGKPFFAWEQFLPITFELGVLLASFGAIFGMLALNGLPMLFHPLFGKKQFLRASDDKFFIAIESTDPKFSEARASLLEAGAMNVEEVDA